MARFQPIYDIAELCSQKGLNQAILCPGSRCAPLTLAFSRHPQITTRTFSDERSAAFIALGIAQQRKSPAILLCTSGSAAYNFAPAVAEAFFSETPLIIFTADRPAEWIAQHDGQTIFQSGIFGKHVKGSFQLPQEYDHPDSQWAINRIVNDAINLSFQEPKGPVHINAPFREPLYPGKEEEFKFNSAVRVIDEFPSSFMLTSEQKSAISSEWNQYNNVLLVAGQQEPDRSTQDSIRNLLTHHAIPVVGDIISNLHGIENLISHSDLFLGQAGDDIKKILHPDLLITFGKSTISKNLKLFLRKFAPRAHWHIQSSGMVADPFQNVTKVFNSSPGEVFDFIASLTTNPSFENQKQKNFCNLWEVEERKAIRILNDFFPQKTLAELEIVRDVIHALPQSCNLHLANSMSVRYANFIGLTANQKGVQVYANRGTSGIDGCTSTAIGHALSNGQPNILITGDLAFFYDRNAFWHNYPIPNLHVLVLNNHGGIIFKIIDGPGSLPEADEYFITHQKLNARKLCEEFGFEYLLLDNRKKVKNLLKDFTEFDNKTKILEFESDVRLNKEAFDNLKKQIKKSYES
ncbi:MAG TPA: 2-succinyl-5-enolpyruvyl-6-hydroxy-3-cyclohexene-1-carboxylic-acid synthase [Ohtaekwangia sp.]